jgi:hypothetical protein
MHVTISREAKMAQEKKRNERSFFNKENKSKKTIDKITTTTTTTTTKRKGQRSITPISNDKKMRDHRYESV